jgi:ABC-type antimicrobial peptide transport system permease subunit
MLKNYFITAIRNFKKNKLNTFLNIFGLGVGMACCLFVFTIIAYEKSFDNFHSNADNIYRVTRHYHGDYGINHGGIIPYPTGDAIVNDIPDFENVIQIHGPVDEKIAFDDAFGNFQIFREDKVIYVEPAFFSAFDFRIVKGNSEALLEPNKAFITEKVAVKYFGRNNPMGKILTINQTEKIEIMGIVETPKDNINHPFEIIISLPTLRARNANFFIDQWRMNWAYSAYVVVAENANIAALEVKLDEMMAKHIDKEIQEKLKMHLQPLKEVHTDERYGAMTYNTPDLLMMAFLVLGGLIMGTACLNFINLSTAQAIKRAKEIGIRKTLGSHKSHLIAQFMIETFSVVFLAMIIAFTLGQIFIQQFNAFLTIIEYNLSYSSEVIGFSLLMSLGVTFLAGFYPSMILAGYQPVQALHNEINIKKGSGNLNLRRTLVITQLAFTNIMLICTVIIAAQMNYVKSSDLGFNAENVITINFPDGSSEKLEVISRELVAKSYVKEVAQAFTPPFASNNWNSGYAKKGEDIIDGNSANRKFGNEDYIEFYEIPLIAGSNITGRYINDSIFDGVATRKLVESLGYTPEESIGQWISIDEEDIKIVGVAENFNNRALTQDMKATIITIRPEMMTQLSLKIADGDVVGHRDDLEATFRDFYPNDLFEYGIVKDDINEGYIVENVLQTVLSVVAGLCILLSIMGLYGLVSFMANSNAKTIGIRKVFGASINHILSTFAKEYAILLLISFVLATPLAYLMMDFWLAEFAYRIDMGLFYFLVAFIISFVIAMGTVSFRSYRAATVNPISSLRYE